MKLPFRIRDLLWIVQNIAEMLLIVECMLKLAS
jgi:hypothetical protein